MIGLEHGFVLSGGGAKGAYEVGVMKAIFGGGCASTRKETINPHIYTGTSVGSYNAAVMAMQNCQSSQAVAYLEQIWRDQISKTKLTCGNGVFRIRGAPLQILDPGCLLRPFQNIANLADDALFLGGFGLAKAAQFTLSDQTVMDRILNLFDISAAFSPAPLHQLIRDTINPRQLHESPHTLKIVASDFLNGLPRVFTKTEITKTIGLQTLDASAAIPGIFPMVDINNTLYVDGGVTMNTPLQPALEAGANVLHIIYLDPMVADVPLMRLEGTLQTLYRLYNILVAKGVNHHFGTVCKLAEEIELLRLMEYLEPHGLSPRADRMMAGNALKFSKVLRDILAGIPVIQAREIHRYRPKTDLGGLPGLLDFSNENINNLIHQGEKDALAHDCSREGCFILEERPFENEDVLLQGSHHE